MYMESIKQQLLTAIIIMFLAGSCMSVRHVNHSLTNEIADPVCGRVVSEDDLTTEFRSTTYYFDSQECRSVFLKDPDRFVSTKRIHQNHTTHWGILGGSLMVVSMIVMMFLL